MVTLVHTRPNITVLSCPAWMNSRPSSQRRWRWSLELIVLVNKLQRLFDALRLCSLLAQAAHLPNLFKPLFLFVKDPLVVCSYEICIILGLSFCLFVHRVGESVFWLVVGLLGLFKDFFLTVSLGFFWACQNLALHKEITWWVISHAIVLLNSIAPKLVEIYKFWVIMARLWEWLFWGLHIGITWLILRGTHLFKSSLDLVYKIQIFKFTGQRLIICTLEFLYF